MQTNTALEILQGRQVVLQQEIKVREKELEAVNVAVQAITDASKFEGYAKQFMVDIDGHATRYDDHNEPESNPDEF